MRVLLVAWGGALGALLVVSPTQAAPLDCPPMAQPVNSDDVREGLKAARDRGFLWHAQRNQRTVWLYGTVHAAQRAWMFPGPVVLNALRESERLALELDVLDPAIGRRLQAAITARAHEPALPVALGRRLVAQADKACLGNGLQGFRPEMQAMTLMALAGRRDGIDPAYGVDGFLAGLARSLGKPVLSLETPESQVSALLQPNIARRNALVDETLLELEKGNTVAGLQRLTQAWADGRLDELEQYGQWCQCLNTPAQREFHERLIERRNGPLARRVMALHEAHRTVFVAVGALHMVGPQGLPALLTQEGFLVNRIALSGDAPR